MRIGNLSLQNASLTEVIDQLARQLHINYILDPAVIGPITNTVSYANANAKAGPYIKDDIKQDRSVYPDAATMKKLFAEATPSPEIERLRTRIWTRIKAGN